MEPGSAQTERPWWHTGNSRLDEMMALASDERVDESVRAQLAEAWESEVRRLQDDIAKRMRDRAEGLASEWDRMTGGPRPPEAQGSDRGQFMSPTPDEERILAIPLGGAGDEIDMGGPGSGGMGGADGTGGTAGGATGQHPAMAALREQRARDDELTSRQGLIAGLAVGALAPAALPAAIARSALASGATAGLAGGMADRYVGGRDVADPRAAAVDLALGVGGGALMKALRAYPRHRVGTLERDPDIGHDVRLARAGGYQTSVLKGMSGPRELGPAAVARQAHGDAKQVAEALAEREAATTAALSDDAAAVGDELRRLRTEQGTAKGSVARQVRDAVAAEDAAASGALLDDARAIRAAVLARDEHLRAAAQRELEEYLASRPDVQVNIAPFVDRLRKLASEGRIERMKAYQVPDAGGGTREVTQMVSAPMPGVTGAMDKALRRIEQAGLDEAPTVSERELEAMIDFLHDAGNAAKVGGGKDAAGYMQLAHELESLRSPELAELVARQRANVEEIRNIKRAIGITDARAPAGRDPADLARQAPTVDQDTQATLNALKRLGEPGSEAISASLETLGARDPQIAKRIAAATDRAMEARNLKQTLGISDPRLYGGYEDTSTQGVMAALGKLGTDEAVSRNLGILAEKYPDLGRAAVRLIEQGRAADATARALGIAAGSPVEASAVAAAMRRAGTAGGDEVKSALATLANRNPSLKPRIERALADLAEARELKRVVGGRGDVASGLGDLAESDVAAIESIQRRLLRLSEPGMEELDAKLTLLAAQKPELASRIEALRAQVAAERLRAGSPRDGGIRGSVGRGGLWLGLGGALNRGKVRMDPIYRFLDRVLEGAAGAAGAAGRAAGDTAGVGQSMVDYLTGIGILDEDNQ